jgi:hypothetical protein
MIIWWWKRRPSKRREHQIEENADYSPQETGGQGSWDRQASRVDQGAGRQKLANRGKHRLRFQREDEGELSWGTGSSEDQ